MPKKHAEFCGVLPIQPILFVRSTTEDNGAPLPNHAQPAIDADLDGDLVKSFYEEVVGINKGDKNTCSLAGNSKDSEKVERSSGPIEDSRVKPEIASSSAHTPRVLDYFKLLNKLLKCAQDGRFSECERCLQDGADVNGQDQYGWTPLMCAAHTGSHSTVRCLLDAKAYACVRNNKGHTAWDIAHLANKKSVIHLLENYCDIVNAEKKLSSEEVLVTFHCDICKCSITDISYRKHCCSTVHRLNAGYKVKDPGFVIPESNRGFKLMVKTGWDKEKGLGPDGTGKKYPVKTHLKQDRSGLGNSSKKKNLRVTHFTANDVKSISNSRVMRSTTLSKRAKSANEKRDRAFERNFRMEFSME